MARFAWLLSMGVGFLSLSQEILWVRLISFTLKGLAQSFALVLFCFLIGIAVGSAIGKRFCERGDDLLRTATIVLAAAAIIDVSWCCSCRPSCNGAPASRGCCCWWCSPRCSRA